MILSLSVTGLCHSSPGELGEVIKEPNSSPVKKGSSAWRWGGYHCLRGWDSAFSPWKSGPTCSAGFWYLRLHPASPEGKFIFFFHFFLLSFVFWELSLICLNFVPEGLTYCWQWVYGETIKWDPLCLISSTSLFGVLPLAYWMSSQLS